MNKIVTILFLLLITSLSLKDLVTYSDFMLNREYIANNLCENRFEPILMCSGSCMQLKDIEVLQLNQRKNNNFIYP